MDYRTGTLVHARGRDWVVLPTERDDLLRLKPGSILALPCQADTPIEGHVNGVAKLQGELVNSGKSVAFQVWSWPATGDPSEGSLQ